MLEQAVYDLMAARPHEPPGARLNAEEYALYRMGYDHALLIALRSVRAAERRFETVERTRRLEAKRKRSAR
jgi:hypothetical protein